MTVSGNFAILQLSLDYPMDIQSGRLINCILQNVNILIGIIGQMGASCHFNLLTKVRKNYEPSYLPFHGLSTTLNRIDCHSCRIVVDYISFLSFLRLLKSVPPFSYFYILGKYLMTYEVSQTEGLLLSQLLIHPFELNLRITAVYSMFICSKTSFLSFPMSWNWFVNL